MDSSKDISMPKQLELAGGVLSRGGQPIARPLSPKRRPKAASAIKHVPKTRRINRSPLVVVFSSFACACLALLWFSRESDKATPTLSSTSENASAVRSMRTSAGSISTDAMEDDAELNITASLQSSPKTLITASLKLEEVGTTWSEPHTKSAFSEVLLKKPELAEDDSRTYKLYWGSNIESTSIVGTGTETRDRIVSFGAFDYASESKSKASLQSSRQATILASLSFEELGTSWSAPRAKSVFSEASLKSEDHLEYDRRGTYKLYWGGSNAEHEQSGIFQLYWGAHGNHISAPKPYELRWRT